LSAMGRIRVVPLLIAAAAGGLLVSGASGADPRTPPALPGTPAPFLGTAVLGDGALTAAVDAYGNLVDLRFPGPAGGAQILNPYARQAAGSVPADTGVVTAASAGRRPPLPLWGATRLDQSYLAATNVLRTRARVGGALVTIEDAADGERLARRIVVRGRPGQRLTLRLGVKLLPTAAIRCRATPDPASRTPRNPDGSRTWRGRGTLIATWSCGFGKRPAAARRLIGEATRADRRWLARRRPLGPGAPEWARRMYARSLLVLRALADHRSGAVAAGARDRWAYVWPRDAGTAAIALARAGYPAAARRAARFLSRLDLGAGARFRGGGSAVEDGRVLPGDATGWVAAAQRAVGIVPRHPPTGGWRDRGDYGERDGDRGDYLANAIAGGAGTERIRRLFAGPSGLQRRAGDPGSGLDFAAAWAVRPFPRPALFDQVRRSLSSLRDEEGRFGVNPSQDWPGKQAWTAPNAWSAWSLAALGERRAALARVTALRRAATPAGLIPERVDPSSGVATSTTPLGWSHSFAILALCRLYG
jgi:glucoamylase